MIYNNGKPFCTPPIEIEEVGPLTIWREDCGHKIKIYSVRDSDGDFLNSFPDYREALKYARERYGEIMKQNQIDSIEREINRKDES